MDVLLQIIVGFLLTGLIGNRLLQGWQARNWFLQQRFLGQEKEYVALKELADEVASLLGVRIFYMQRLNRALASGTDEKINSRLQEYDAIVKRWNERLTSFYIRLPILAEYDLARRLENSIQTDLVKIGAAIESMAGKREAGATNSRIQTARIESELIALQGKAIAFNKRLLNVLHSRRTDVYFGKALVFSSANIRYFSTWQLVKALFVRDINSLSIVRAPIDS